MADIEEFKGIYPVVRSQVFTERAYPHPSWLGASTLEAAASLKPSQKAAPEDLACLIYGRNVSISLWFIPLDHVSVPESERNAGMAARESGEAYHAPRDEQPR